LARPKNELTTWKRSRKKERHLGYPQCGAKALGLSVTLALLLSPAVAAAGPFTLFTDRDAFLAAANPNTLFTFDDPTATVCGLTNGGDPVVCRADFGGVEAAYFQPTLCQFLSPCDY